MLMVKRWLRSVALAPLLLCVPACHQDQARLAVDLAEPATADALVFHGNCLAGWSVRLTLGIRETGGAEVWFEGLDYVLEDLGYGEEIVDESLDAASLTSRYGTRMVEPHGRLLLPLSGPYGKRPLGPIEASGELRGRDAEGNALAAPFRLTSPSLVVHDETPGPGGACP